MSQTQKENQSLFTNTVWTNVAKVVNFFEDGRLKNQKLNKKDPICTPEIK